VGDDGGFGEVREIDAPLESVEVFTGREVDGFQVREVALKRLSGQRGQELVR
jgi:hypothetical protein